MKSKKIERLQKMIRENIAEMEVTDSIIRKNEIIAENERLHKEINATRNRNLWARERNQAMRDCGLVKTPYGWE